MYFTSFLPIIIDMATEIKVVVTVGLTPKKNSSVIT